MWLGDKSKNAKSRECFLVFITALGSTPHKELLRAAAKSRSAFPIITSNSRACFWLKPATGKPRVNRAGHWGRAPATGEKSGLLLEQPSPQLSYKTLTCLTLPEKQVVQPLGPGGTEVPRFKVSVFQLIAPHTIFLQYFFFHVGLLYHNVPALIQIILLGLEFCWSWHGVWEKKPMLM